MELVPKVTDLFTPIDKNVAEYHLKSGLRCPVLCDACCPTADAQTTVLEMLPAAQEILRRDAGTFWLNRINLQNPSG